MGENHWDPQHGATPAATQPVGVTALRSQILHLPAESIPEATHNDAGTPPSTPNGRVPFQGRASVSRGGVFPKCSQLACKTAPGVSSKGPSFVS